ncbi:ATP-dependent Clp protease ATP-binding subunit CLPT1, chloroplastic [Juglans microcarpa x Juglans regia]|uniref:ATP-dependent Clp protease ATP-binding subunit CLPT1, chloroplastic n=1 Tax=Juglans microcarpa x Juglans regia TaxID=2249226 RepID=UPI001B7EE783|nr:ATP-dependent Clp protease ATP-binding subunit CLPT1, chloroplastic [Juglans microcarpa x Juglans regia]
MASHTLSGLPIILYCNSQSCHRNAPDTDSSSSSSSSTLLRRPKHDNLTTPFTGRKLSIRSSSSQRFVSKHRSAIATVLLSLPTLKPERASSDKTPKWSARAIKSFAMGKLEARKLKYPNTGTEALLMGILVEGTSIAAKFLRANGITLFKVREETVKLLGKSDMYYFSPEHPPLTEPAQRALDWAVDEKLKSGEDGEITTSYLLLGIWSEKDSAGHKIMASLGFDDEKAKELAKTINEDFVLSHK